MLRSSVTVTEISRGSAKKRILYLLVGYIAFLYLLVPFGNQLFQIFNKIVGMEGIRVLFYILLGGGGSLFSFFLLSQKRRGLQDRRRTLFRRLLILGLAILASLRLVNPAEKFHLLQYGILGVLLEGVRKNSPFFLALPSLSTQKDKGMKDRLWFQIPWVFLGGVVGLGEELFQGITPGRYFEWRDTGWNFAGVLFGYTFAFCGKDNHEYGSISG